MAHRRTAISSFPKAVLETSVIGLAFLLRGSFSGDYSPTAPAALSLRPLVPTSSLTSCEPVQVYHHHLCYFQRAVFWTSRLLALQPPVRESAWRSCWMPSRFLDVATVLRLGPLFHCCLPGASVVSSRASVLRGLLLQHCPFLVPDDRVPCAVQEWHCGSSVCRRRPNSSGTLQCPDSFCFGVFVRDFKVSRCVRHLFWGCLLPLQVDLCCSLAGRHAGFHPFLMGVHLGYDFLWNWANLFSYGQLVGSYFSHHPFVEFSHFG
jgi:hypothetical protein